MKMGKGRKCVARAAERYRKWMKPGEEVTYPNCFWQQLGICAALFLVIFGAKQMRAEPVQAVLSTVRSVATTQVQLDPDIGKVEYVSKLVPESVLVFWNAQDKTLFAPFADGLLLESGEEALFEGSGAVRSGAAGKMQAVEERENGYSVTILYDCGLQAEMYPLRSVRVEKDARVQQGQSIGTAHEVGRAAQVCVRVTEGRRVLQATEWLR